MTMIAPPLARSSSRPPSPQLPLEAGDHLDQQAFHALYKQMPPGIKAELIGGVVYMPSPVTDFHAQPHADFMGCLFVYRSHTPGIGTSDNGTAILGDDSEPQPDAFMRVLAGGQTRLDEDGYVVGCPEMVCEVSNSSVSYDLHAKLRDYERYGALEYVAAIVRDGRVAWFARIGERLVEVPPDADGIYRSRAFPGFWLDPAALLRGDFARLLDVLNQGLATSEHAAFAASLTPLPLNSPPSAASGG